MKKAILVSVLALAGCAAGPDNVEALKRANHKDEFSVGLGYQQVYRNLKAGFTECTGMESRWLKPFTVDAELFSDINEGQLTVKVVPTVGKPKPTTYITVNEKTDHGSVVTIYYGWHGHVKEGGPLYRRWANGDLSCE